MTQTLPWLANSASEVLAQRHSLRNIWKSGKKPHLHPARTASSSSVHFPLHLPTAGHLCAFTLTGTIFPRSLFTNSRPFSAREFWRCVGSEERSSPGCCRARRGLAPAHPAWPLLLCIPSTARDPEQLAGPRSTGAVEKLCLSLLWVQSPLGGSMGQVRSASPSICNHSAPSHLLHWVLRRKVQAAWLAGSLGSTVKGRHDLQAGPVVWVRSTCRFLNAERDPRSTRSWKKAGLIIRFYLI